MDENKVLTEKDLLIKYLSEVLSFHSQKTVGKLLKRFEIITDIALLKKEAKELIYEEFRDIIEIMEAYGKGMEMTIFNFRKSEEK
jgi:hypothetical protein